MHPYATDSNEREQVFFGLALLAIGCAWTLSRLLVAFHTSVPWWLDAPSTVGFYGAWFGLFDRLLWRMPFLRGIGLVKVPFLAGAWSGHLLSSYDNHSRPHRVGVQIEQSWTRMRLLLRSDTSRSHTLLAAVEVHALDGTVLSYQYLNEPLPNAKETMQIHHGTAWLKLEGENCLEGYYYSGRGRQEHGQMFLERNPGLI